MSEACRLDDDGTSWGKFQNFLRLDKDKMASFLIVKISSCCYNATTNSPVEVVAMSITYDLRTEVESNCTKCTFRKVSMDGLRFPISEFLNEGF